MSVRTVVLGWSLLALVSCASPKPAQDSAPSAPAAPVSEKSVTQTQVQTAAAAAVSSATTNVELESVTTCSKRSSERLIKIQKVEGGCWVMYHNGDIKKRVAWSRNGIRHCESVRDNIRSNLEGSGYRCSSQPKPTS